MQKFNFDEYSSTLNVSDFKPECKKKHVHKIAILNVYDVDLYTAWAIELEHAFSKLPNARVSILNLGLNFLHLQRSIFRQVGTLLLRSQATQKILKQKRYQIAYSPFKHRVISWNPIFRAVISAVRAFKLKSLMQRNETLAETQKQKSIFSTMATSFGTVEFSVRKNILKILMLNLAYELTYKRTSDILQEINPCVMFIGNGRLVKAAAAVAASRDHSIETKIVERGAFPGTLDLYRVSPHSIQERRDQVQALSKKFGEDKRKKIAREYIELRREYDPISGIRWQRKFETGKLPPLDNRKICVCFTSTETEFAVFGDEVPTDHFQSQEEAFRALALALNPNEWQVIIRRHPYGTKKLKSDPEKKLWNNLSNLNHVEFVGPSEPVDSYELSRVADLIAHFNSSMGPEAISLQSAPVITMGPTIWENEESSYNVCSSDKLQTFLNSSPKVRELSEIFNWGLYWATFGYKFNKVEWKSSKGFVNGKRIL